MYVQQSVELLYLGLVACFIVFMAVFIRTTARTPAKKTGTGEIEERTKGMDSSEKKWLAVLLVIALIGNVLLLSALVPAARTAIWGTAPPSKTVYVTAGNYTFNFSEATPIRVISGQAVEFVAWSTDVTYGLGVFRSDGTMVFQMQIVPGYDNRIVWIFDEPGVYTIRSTEYSGPRHSEMVVPNAILVEG